MLKKIAALAVVVSILSQAGTTRADGWSWKNIFGGQDYYGGSSNYLGRTTPNISGGYNYIGSTGQSVGQSSRNIFGGQNYQFGQTSGYSRPNVFGGRNYNFGGSTGYTMPNTFGGQNYNFGGGQRLLRPEPRRGLELVLQLDFPQRPESRKPSDLSRSRASCISTLSVCNFAFSGKTRNPVSLKTTCSRFHGRH